jgi:hypothetical protein
VTGRWLPHMALIKINGRFYNHGLIRRQYKSRRERMPTALYIRSNLRPAQKLHMAIYFLGLIVILTIGTIKLFIAIAQGLAVPHHVA